MDEKSEKKRDKIVFLAVIAAVVFLAILLSNSFTGRTVVNEEYKTCMTNAFDNANMCTESAGINVAARQACLGDLKADIEVCKNKFGENN